METLILKKSIKKEKSTIHTSRTLMFSELSKVMDHAIEDDKYIDSLNANIANKQTKTNQIKTIQYLRKLYDFDLSNPKFIAFKYFWQITGPDDKPKLALLYALNKDYLLSESIPVVTGTSIGDKVVVAKFVENIESNHLDRFSEKTRLSIAQNIASSWKQAGFITGKVKNLRSQPLINYQVTAFAFFLAFLSGKRGDFIMASSVVKALCLGETRVRELVKEAAKRDLLQYQYAGNVTAISFNNLIKKLGINGI